MLNIDGGVWVGWLLWSLFCSESFLFCDLRPSTRSTRSAFVSAKPGPKGPGAGKVRASWSLELHRWVKARWSRPESWSFIILSCFLSLAFFGWFVYFSYLCQVLRVALFSVSSSKWKVPQRQGVYFLLSVSVDILGAEVSEPNVQFVSLWHQTMDCEMCQRPWRLPRPIISSFRWETEARKGMWSVQYHPVS